MTRTVDESGRAALLAHPGSELYGSDRVFLDSAVALQKGGWAVTVTLPSAGELADILANKGINVVIGSTPVLRKSALRPRGLLRLGLETIRALPASIGIIRRTKPDVVYVSTVIIPLWSILGWLFRVPVVCHVHEAETEPAKLLRTLLALPLLTTSRIVINSEFSRATLLDSLPRLEPRIEVVTNPVGGPPEVTPVRAELAAAVNLLFIGRLSPRKGPDVAVQALAILRQRGFDARLKLLGAVFEGYEWFESDLRSDVRRLGLTEYVEFLGFSNDVWPTIEQADIVLVPSVADEPFGNTAVEAVLAARPVVASTSGGLVEAIRGYSSARSASPGDSDELADAVEDLLANWSETATSALVDARAAAERHSPELYGERLNLALDRACRN